MLPVLRACENQSWTVKQLILAIADELDLSKHDRGQRIPGGETLVINSRVQWAKTCLVKDGLLSEPQRGVVSITPKGRDRLAAGVRSDAPLAGGCGTDICEQAAGQAAYETLVSRETAVSDRRLFAQEGSSSDTPEEKIRRAVSSLNNSLRRELLLRILGSSPVFFERLIIKLLVGMGYGGSVADAGQQLGGTGDGGVDGVIREDHLGLDRIYIQAKRYAIGSPIGSPAIRDFIGALVGKNAHRGVFITTSHFSDAARETAEKSGDRRLVLIDGEELTSLMLQFNVGVRVNSIIELKQIDLNCFVELEDD